MKTKISDSFRQIPDTFEIDGTNIEQEYLRYNLRMPDFTRLGLCYNDSVPAPCRL